MTADDWAVRLQAAITVHKRRRKLREIARAEMAEARRIGKQRRHARRLAETASNTDRIQGMADARPDHGKKRAPAAPHLSSLAPGADPTKEIN